MFENTNKGILNDILGLRLTPQDRVSHAKEQRGISRHKSREIDLRPRTLHGRQRQATALDRRHKYPSIHKDALGQFSLDNILDIFRSWVGAQGFSPPGQEVQPKINLQNVANYSSRIWWRLPPHLHHDSTTNYHAKNHVRAHPISQKPLEKREIAAQKKSCATPNLKACKLAVPARRSSLAVDGHAAE